MSRLNFILRLAVAGRCAQNKKRVATHLFVKSLKQAARNTKQVAAALAEVAACEKGSEFDKLSKKALLTLVFIPCVSFALLFLFLTVRHSTDMRIERNSANLNTSQTANLVATQTQIRTSFYQAPQL
jgi:hypothetical protein